jgi:Uma2 family endonuclease
MSIYIELPADRRAAVSFDEQLTPREFADFCERQPDLLVEREVNGQITVMSPVHLLSGNFESKLNFYLSRYLYEQQIGEAFSASTGFTLPDSSVRSADVAFVSAEKLAALSKEEKHSFAAIVPDFVIELRSDTDKLGRLQTKMKDTWIDNGVRLAWLIDPKNEVTYIYRQDGSERVVAGFDQILDGEDVLPGFQFELSVLTVD